MSPLVRYILLALLAAVLAFGLTYMLLRPASDAQIDEMVWMQKEFDLTSTQVAAIEQLHAEYNPVCMEHCRLITQARKNLSSSSDKVAAQAELARLETVCRDATLGHLQRVAAVMPPEQRARFLDLVTPKLSEHQHDAPLGLK